MIYRILVKNISVSYTHLDVYKRQVFEEGRNVLSGLGNVWVDCSSSLWLITPEYAHELIIAFGPDRVMFGTDYPVKYCDDELKRFAELPLAAEERDDILWNNAHKYILGE